MTNTEKKHKEYVLTPGVLRIARGVMDRDSAEAVGHRAGVTEGGCTLRYEYKESDLRDTSGDVVSILKYGEKVILEGELVVISPEAMALLREKEVTATLTCPLPDGDSICVTMRGAVPSIGKLTLKRGGRLSFRIVSAPGLSDWKMTAYERGIAG